MAATVESTHSDRRWLILATLSVAQLMVLLDATIVNIALPSAQKIRTARGRSSSLYFQQVRSAAAIITPPALKCLGLGPTRRRPGCDLGA